MTKNNGKEDEASGNYFDESGRIAELTETDNVVEDAAFYNLYKKE